MWQRIAAILFLITLSIIMIVLCATDQIPDIYVLHTVIYYISGVLLLFGLYNGVRVIRKV